MKELKIRKQRDDWPCFLKNIARSYYVAALSSCGDVSRTALSRPGRLGDGSLNSGQSHTHLKSYYSRNG